MNTVINQAQSVLNSLNLSDFNVTTAYIYLYPVYNYTNGISYVIGQQASLGLRVVVGNLNVTKDLLGSVASNLSTVNNISLSGFSFQNSDTTQAYRSARFAAVADAQSKFLQYVMLSGRSSTSCAINILDQNVDRYVPFDISPSYYAFQSKILSVPYGKVKVYANVQIKWKLHGW